MHAVLIFYSRQALLIAGSIVMVLLTVPIKVCEDGCPDTAINCYGLPFPFKRGELGITYGWPELFTSGNWNWKVFWIDVAVVYFMVVGLLKVREILQNAKRERSPRRDIN